MKNKALIMVLMLLVIGGVLAQRQGGFGGGGGYGRGRGRGNSDSVRTPREMGQHGVTEDGSPYETPYWTNTTGFEKDVFTFVRIKRGSTGGYGYGSGGPWDVDAPDSDLNLSFRIQQLTSIKVNPDGLFLRLTDPELVDYPFIYMVEPGSLFLNDAEIVALRKYLLNGGFLWLDDFWGDSAWNNVEHVLKQVFPDRSFVELSLDHPLYHCVFEIKEKGQVTAVEIGTASEYTHVTWETRHDGDVRTVHHRAIFDDKGRMMVFATHNTDNGDGWEWEGNNHYYFEQFAEKIAYPLAINVVFYVMTH